jgi:(S)-sulfolactate dehydrogenase
MMDAAHPAYAQNGAQPLALAELMATADVISLHVPLVDGTRRMFDAARIAAMKRGAVLINSARGGIVDEAAVAAALKTGHLGGAVLDVFEVEPMPAGGAFDGCPNLILTPHIAGVTSEANERVSFMIAAKVLEVLS